MIAIISKKKKPKINITLEGRVKSFVLNEEGWHIELRNLVITQELEDIFEFIKEEKSKNFREDIIIRRESDDPKTMMIKKRNGNTKLYFSLDSDFMVQMFELEG